MRIGLFSNGQRRNSLAKISYQADLDEIVLADRLSISEAWISEHGTLLPFLAPDQLPCADLLICKAGALTKQIRLGPGIRPLPYYHPLQIATEAAVCDHLLDGRYMAGFGLGIGTGRGQRGRLPASQREMFHEAIDLILTAWTADEPFDWNGKVWQGQNWQIIPKPLTLPHMEVGLACSRSDSTLELAAANGFSPLLSWSPTAAQIRDMIATYLGARSDGPRVPAREHLRVSRYIYVSDSLSSARRELQDADFGPVIGAGRLDGHIPPGGSRADLNLDTLIKSGAILCGSTDDVRNRLLDFIGEVGGFGTLLLVTGKDWAPPPLLNQSMERFMAD
jgi:alkanesulfonate monooxygenase SsuD/methylene tetrahydromethanopterin reductase-like flavin-dependent oxidoreductase (luciferase family)